MATVSRPGHRRNVPRSHRYELGRHQGGHGNGSAVTLNVYGNIPAQTSPSVGLYADTVGVLVTF